MNLIEKISLTVFSIIILILSLVVVLMLYSWLGVSTVSFAIQFVVNNPTASGITLAVSIALMLLAVKCLCFPSYSKSGSGKTEGILLENETGKLLISIETIENLAKGVINQFQDVKGINCKVGLDKQINNVTIDLNLIVSSDTVIKDLSVKLQDKIKEVIKNTTDIEVKQINIKIKNIETPKE